MTKIKTCELTDAALDWAVAMCDYDAGNIAIKTQESTPYILVFPEDRKPSKGGVRFHPSNDSAQCDVIVDREKIATFPSRRYVAGWEATPYTAVTASEHSVFQGFTRRIAAMRCYAASKLGDEVDIPDELIQRARKTKVSDLRGNELDVAVAARYSKPARNKKGFKP